MGECGHRYELELVKLNTVARVKVRTDRVRGEMSGGRNDEIGLS